MCDTSILWTHFRCTVLFMENFCNRLVKCSQSTFGQYQYKLECFQLKVSETSSQTWITRGKLLGIIQRVKVNLMALKCPQKVPPSLSFFFVLFSCSFFLSLLPWGWFYPKAASSVFVSSDQGYSPLHSHKQKCPDWTNLSHMVIPEPVTWPGRMSCTRWLRPEFHPYSWINTEPKEIELSWLVQNAVKICLLSKFLLSNV